MKSETRWMNAPVRSPSWRRLRHWTVASALLGLVACERSERLFNDRSDAGNGGANAAESRSRESEPPTSGNGGSSAEDVTSPRDSSVTQDLTLNLPGDSGESTSSGAEASTENDQASSSGGASPTSFPDEASTDDGSCRPVGDEQCFNGKDDDCNGLTDCADAACADGARCVPMGEHLGVLIAVDEQCPTGYSPLYELHHELTGGGCEGCSCTARETACEGSLHFYASERECSQDAAQTGGTLADPVTFTCPARPLVDGSVYGYRAGVRVSAGTGTCTARGTAAPMAPVWATSGKYCVADVVGTGCQFGYACAPHQTLGETCNEAANGECAPGTTVSEWYEDYTDTRTCGECRCDGAGDCSKVGVQVGNDWTCLEGNAVAYDGERRCVQHYSPPAQLVGSPANPQCTPESTLSGELSPAGRHTLCCRE